MAEGIIMNTAQLECFISLAGTLNYMKTSEQLGLTQPAVTKGFDVRSNITRLTPLTLLSAPPASRRIRSRRTI